jgi:hypothetical protein
VLCTQYPLTFLKYLHHHQLKSTVSNPTPVSTRLDWWSGTDWRITSVVCLDVNWSTPRVPAMRMSRLTIIFGGAVNWKIEKAEVDWLAHDRIPSWDSMLQWVWSSIISEMGAWIFERIIISEELWVWLIAWEKLRSISLDFEVTYPLRFATPLILSFLLEREVITVLDWLKVWVSPCSMPSINDVAYHLKQAILVIAPRQTPSHLRE